MVAKVDKTVNFKYIWRIVLDNTNYDVIKDADGKSIVVINDIRFKVLPLSRTFLI